MIILFFIFGAIFGSFGNVLIYRLPRNESIFYPASHCTKCKNKLKFYHNVPIFSWIFLKAKCSFCNEKIGINYPLVEFLSGLLAVIAFYFESNFNSNFSTQILIKSAILSLVFTNLLCLSVIDIQYKAVPNALLYTCLILSILYSFNIQSIICATVFMALFWLLRFIVSKAKKREALGSADIFIAGIIGSILGYLLGFVAIYIAAILTLPFFLRKRNLELAFVPFLTIGLLLTYIFKIEILTLMRDLYE